MTMIFCDESCIYQHEGCCTLEYSTSVTNCSDSGCIHRLDYPDDKMSISGQKAPQQHHG